jgi:hypothetical protein
MIWWLWLIIGIISVPIFIILLSGLGMVILIVLQIKLFLDLRRPKDKPEYPCPCCGKGISKEYLIKNGKSIQCGRDEYYFYHEYNVKCPFCKGKIVSEREIDGDMGNWGYIDNPHGGFRLRSKEQYDEDEEVHVYGPFTIK